MSSQATISYPFIVVHGRRLGSMPYYINDQIEKAHAAGAPRTAVYEQHANDGRGPTGHWVDFSEFRSEEVKEAMLRDIEHYFPGWLAENCPEYAPVEAPTP